MSENAASPHASDAFKKLVEGCTDSSQLQEALRNYREQEAAAASAPAAAAPAPPVVPESQVGREDFGTVIYPGGSNRFEIWADSQQELDAKVAAIYKMFGKS